MEAVWRCAEQLKKNTQLHSPFCPQSRIQYHAAPLQLYHKSPVEVSSMPLKKTRMQIKLGALCNVAAGGSTCRREPGGGSDVATAAWSPWIGASQQRMLEPTAAL